MAAKKLKAIEIVAAKPFNEHRKGMAMSAGNAGAAITVDTRNRQIRARKGAGSYRRRDRFGRDY